MITVPGIKLPSMTIIVRNSLLHRTLEVVRDDLFQISLSAKGLRSILKAKSSILITFRAVFMTFCARYAPEWALFERNGDCFLPPGRDSGWRRGSPESVTVNPTVRLLFNKAQRQPFGNLVETPSSRGYIRRNQLQTTLPARREPASCARHSGPRRSWS